jgi:integrase
LIKVNKPHDLAVQKSGVSFVLYDLRHTFATRMSAQGTDPLTLASILGHANLRTIQRYVHPQSATQKLAQERYEAAMNRRKFRVV